jgi:hypothetical protein
VYRWPVVLPQLRGLIVFYVTVVERRLLAWAYTFSEAPHPRIAKRPPPVVD